MIFYGNIQIPRISGNFDACADSVYQALFPRKKGSLGSRLNSAMHAIVIGSQGRGGGGGESCSVLIVIRHTIANHSSRCQA